MARHRATSADRPWHVITYTDVIFFLTVWFGTAITLKHYFHAF